MMDRVHYISQRYLIPVRLFLSDAIGQRQAKQKHRVTAELAWSIKA
jgi:hypothetical protein